LIVETDSRLRTGRRSLRRLCKRDFSSLDGYDRVVDVEAEVYSESFELVESRLSFSVEDDKELEITWPWVKVGCNMGNRVTSVDSGYGEGEGTALQALVRLDRLWRRRYWVNVGGQFRSSEIATVIQIRSA
jgi:hypothetical protein